MPEIVWNFLKIGDAELKEAIKQIGEEGVRAATQQQRAQAAMDAQWRINMDKRLGTSRDAHAAAERDAARYAARAEAEWNRQRAKREVAEARSAQQKIRNEERASATRLRSIEKMVREEQRATARVDQQVDRERRARAEGYARFVQRNDERMALARAHAETAAENRSRARMGTLGGAMGTFGGMAKGFLIGKATDILHDKVSTIMAAAHQATALQDAALRLSIQSRGTGEEFRDPAALRKEFQRVAMANAGVRSQDLAEGAQGFVGKTGDLEAAMKFNETFAVVSQATGSRIQDITDAAADLFKKFDVKTVDDMRAALTTLTMQGKKGSFELRDAAKQFARIGAAAARFGLKGKEGVATLGAFSQIAREATGTGPQAATAVEAMFRQLVVKAGKGVDPFVKGSKTQTRPIEEVVFETIAKNKGDLTKMQKIFATEGARGVTELVRKYNVTVADQLKGGAKQKDAEAAGMAAMKQMFQDAKDAGGDWADMLKDQEMAQQSWSVRSTQAMESLAHVAGEKLGPKLAELAGKLATGKGLDNMMMAAEAAGDALAAFVDLLERLGLISGGTAEEKAQAEEKVAATEERKAKSILKNLNYTDQDQLAMSTMTDAQKRQFQEAHLESFGSQEKQDAYRASILKRDQMRSAAEQHRRTDSIAYGAVQDVKNAQTSDEARNAAMLAYGKAGGSYGMFDFANRMPGGGLIASVGGETPEQKAIREAYHNFSAPRVAGSTYSMRYGGDIDPRAPVSQIDYSKSARATAEGGVGAGQRPAADAAASSMETLAKSAKTASDTLAKINNPSVFAGGPGRK